MRSSAGTYEYSRNEEMTVLLLVEGATEAAFYRPLLERHYNATIIDPESLPKAMRELLAPLQAERKRLTPLNIGDTFVVLIECRGFDELKLCLRKLLKRPELIDAVHNDLKAFIVAADLDKAPHESLRGLLASASHTRLHKEGRRLYRAAGSHTSPRLYAP